MLAALNGLSRASRRASAAVQIGLDALCAGAPAALVALDETTAEELGASIPGNAIATLDAGAATISWAVDGLDGSPLQALAGSLQAYAGGPVEALACLEVALDRHHGRLEAANGRVEVLFPILEGAAS